MNMDRLIRLKNQIKSLLIKGKGFFNAAVAVMTAIIIRKTDSDTELFISLGTSIVWIYFLTCIACRPIKAYKSALLSAKGLTDPIYAAQNKVYCIANLIVKYALRLLMIAIIITAILYIFIPKFLWRWIIAPIHISLSMWAFILILVQLGINIAIQINGKVNTTKKIIALNIILFPFSAIGIGKLIGDSLSDTDLFGVICFSILFIHIGMGHFWLFKPKV